MIVRKRRKRRNERRNESDRKKERKNCKLGVFGRTSDFSIIIHGLDFNSLVRSFETRNFVHSVQLQELVFVKIQVRICIFILLLISLF